MFNKYVPQCVLILICLIYALAHSSIYPILLITYYVLGNTGNLESLSLETSC